MGWLVVIRPDYNTNLISVCDVVQTHYIAKHDPNNASLYLEPVTRANVVLIVQHGAASAIA
jgi:hypothetical protein